MKAAFVLILFISSQIFASESFEAYRSVIASLENAHFQSQKAESDTIYLSLPNNDLQSLQTKLSNLRRALLNLELRKESPDHLYRNKIKDQASFFKALKAAFNKIDPKTVPKNLRQAYGQYWRQKNSLKKVIGIEGRP